MESRLYGSINENSSERIFDGKRFPMSIVLIEEKIEKRVISAARFVKSEIKVDLLLQWRNPMP